MSATDAYLKVQAAREAVKKVEELSPSAKLNIDDVLESIENTLWAIGNEKEPTG